MKNLTVLIVVVLSAFLFGGGCKTTGTSSNSGTLTSIPVNWSGYNADGRLRIDVLVVKSDDKVAKLVEEARNHRKFSQLPFDVFEMVQKGKVERADGVQQVLVEFTNPAMPFGKFFSYHYGDTNNPSHPAEVIPVSDSENQGRFQIEARHGYASLDMPYGYINEATFVEVSVPGVHTLFPFDGDTVMNKPGELYELTRSNKQFFLMLVVLAGI